jgi:endoglucanase
VVQKTTAATLDFAAVMAVASRIHTGYERQFPGVAARMRKAAESAWRWALANPAVTYRQPPDVVTGAYGDRVLADEFVWAAAELFLLTSDESYLKEFSQRSAAPNVMGVPSWSDAGGLALVSLAHSRARLPAEQRARVESELDTLAAKLAAQWRDSPWKVSMQQKDFVWGSNAVVLNQAMMLLQGYRLNGKRDYLDAAQSQLDYALGRNPLGVSFVTGIGLRTPMHIHHRPSEADGIDAPVPGLLSGGPNPGQQDAKDCPSARYSSKAPALSWLDHECSYASNEIAINWNAPLVYVASAMQALKDKP